MWKEKVCKMRGNIEKLDRLVPIVEKLTKIKWNTRLNFIEQQLKQILCVLIEDKVVRKSYKIEDEIILDLYLSDHQLLEAEVNFDVTIVNRDLMSEYEYEDLNDKYFSKFEEATGRLKEILGEPKFSNGIGCLGFPPDQDAQWISMWDMDDYRLMLEQKHEDKELPFRICVVFSQ